MYNHDTQFECSIVLRYATYLKTIIYSRTGITHYINPAALLDQDLVIFDISVCSEKW